MAKKSIRIGDLLIAYGTRNSLALGVVTDIYTVTALDDVRYDIAWINIASWGNDSFMSESTVLFYREEYERWRKENL